MKDPGCSSLCTPRRASTAYDPLPPPVTVSNGTHAALSWATTGAALATAADTLSRRSDGVRTCCSAPWYACMPTNLIAPPVSASSSRARLASDNTRDGSSTPHLSCPTLTSTITSSLLALLVPSSPAAPSPSPPFLASSASTCSPSALSYSTRTRTPAAASATRRATLRGAMTSFDTRMSVIPPAAIASASLTFWQQIPCARSPNSLICMCAIWGVLCALACGLSLMFGKGATVASSFSQLRSAASRSSSRAGVSTSSMLCPAWAGGRRADRDAHACGHEGITPAIAVALTVKALL
mmetsp:Transcript_35176/g.89044  ORF Transcript_35176/g.89044 Transcript_35176/m.89044 type:complete len:296 (+) Transcript_35176:641-1528(+)